MNMKFWKFWTILVFIAFTLITGQIFFGMFEFILANDSTYLTLANIGLLLFSQILLMRAHLKKEYIESDHKMIRYLSETVVSLGLVGTLIGFMIVLWSVFGPGVVIDASNVASMTAIIIAMSQGMAAALITSLSGIAAAVLINLQLVILEQ